MAIFCLFLHLFINNSPSFFLIYNLKITPSKYYKTFLFLLLCIVSCKNMQKLLLIIYLISIFGDGNKMFTNNLRLPHQIHHPNGCYPYIRHLAHYKY